jgi:hypothetical protein
MEVEPEQGGSHARLLRHRRRHSGPDGGKRIGTRRRVECRRQLGRRRRRHAQ